MENEDIFDENWITVSFVRSCCCVLALSPLRQHMGYLQLF